MALLTDAEVIKAFGEPGNPDNFTIIQLPYPMRIAWDLKTQVHKMQCHELAEYRFLSVFKDLLTHYGFEEIKKLGIDIFGGCVNVRLMRGSKTKWSRHAWGIAIDLDPARNGLKTSWANSQFSKKEYEPMHQIFEMYGFLNYGKVKGFDSMHYELTS